MYCSKKSELLKRNSFWPFNWPLIDPKDTQQKRHLTASKTLKKTRPEPLFFHLFFCLFVPKNVTKNVTKNTLLFSLQNKQKTSLKEPPPTHKSLFIFLIFFLCFPLLFSLLPLVFLYFFYFLLFFSLLFLFFFLFPLDKSNLLCYYIDTKRKGE